jgi:uncharacterized coiled-coil DUF342 family protein
MDVLFALAAICIYILIVTIIYIIINKISDFSFNNKHLDYIEFKKKYDELRRTIFDDVDDIDSAIKFYKKRVDYYLEEIKYYPENSEYHQYLEKELDTTRERINKYKEESGEKRSEISKFVKDNRDVIESIKEDKRELYDYWVNSYDLR